MTTLNGVIDAYKKILTCLAEHSGDEQYLLALCAVLDKGILAEDACLSDEAKDTSNPNHEGDVSNDLHPDNKMPTDAVDDESEKNQDAQDIKEQSKDNHASSIEAEQGQDDTVIDVKENTQVVPVDNHEPNPNDDNISEDDEDSEQSELFERSEKLLADLNCLIGKVADANKNNCNIAEIRDLYHDTSELLAEFRAYKIDTFVSTLVKMDGNIHSLESADPTSDLFSEALGSYIKQEKRYHKNFRRFLQVLGCDMIKPRIGDEYNPDTMDALNLDEVDESKVVVVSKVQDGGYIQMIEGKAKIAHKSIVMVQNKES